MAKALSEQMALPESQALSFEERLGLLVDREMTARSERRLTARLRQAKVRLSASLEDIDYRHPRGRDKALLLSSSGLLLAVGPRPAPWAHHVPDMGQWGKTWLSCASGATRLLRRRGTPSCSLRLPRLLQERPMAQGDGRYPQLMAALAKTAIRILDDWGLASLSDENRRDVLALLADRPPRPWRDHRHQPVPSGAACGMRPWVIAPWLTHP